MEAGKLDQRIGLKSPSEANDSGSLKITYADAGTVWGHVISQKGSEAFESARTNARRMIRVCLRYRDDVTDKWAITWQGQSYNVVDVDRSGRRDGELWLTAECVGAS